MNEHNQQVELDLEDVIDRATRTELTPWWIKITSWLLLIVGPVMAGLIVADVYNLMQRAPEALESNFVVFTILFQLILFLFKTFVAYLILFEKDRAMLFGKIDCYYTLGAAIVSMYAGQFLGVNIGAAIVVICMVIMFLIWLNRITHEWAEARSSRKQA